MVVMRRVPGGCQEGATTALPPRPVSRHVAAGAAARRRNTTHVIATDAEEVEVVADADTAVDAPGTDDDSSSTSSNAPAALTSKGLGVVRGHTLPPVPPENVHWVCDVDGIERMRRAVLDLNTVDGGNPTTREGYPPVVGLDGEWKPGSRTPVSILQVATRTEAFVVDLFACAPADSPACETFDAFLHDMLQTRELYKLGFSFGYDLSRMRASYPHLASLRAGEPKSMIDVKQVAYSASANRMNLRIGLATLTKFALGATLSKQEQCSDWARRPLTKAQLAYAAADAFYLNLIFDKCVAKSNGKLLTRLDEMVAMGDPRAKGKHLPRKAKKALKKQMALSARLMQQAGGGKPLGHAQRERDMENVNVNVENALSSVGAACEKGRKGAVKLLSGGADVRQGKRASRGSSVEVWANAAVLYLSVGQPGKGKHGVGDFWEEKVAAGGGGDGGEDCAGDIIMRPHEASFVGVAPEVMARFSGALTSRIRTMADAAEDTSPAAAEPQGVGKGEEGTKDEEEGESLRERARVEESKQQTALLFMRRPPGHYVFCGRLEAVNGGGGGGGEDGNPVGWLRLVDTAPLRSSSTFHQLIGCRLLPEAPAAEVQEA